eukprot:s3545_g5.t1
MESFLQHFQFASLGSALKQTSGMGAVACAALSGDTAMVRNLVEMRASIETALPELWQVALPIKATPLIMTLTRVDRGQAALVELLKSRADPNSCDGNGGAALCYCTSPQAVDLLVEYRADVNLRKAPTMMAPISGMCARGAPPEAVTRLLELRADVNLSDGDLGQTAIVYLTIFFSGNMRGLEVADVLLRARADVNKISKIAPAVQVVEYGARALKLFKKELPLLISWLAEGSTTALGAACFFGSQEMVRVLLGARADPNIRNRRGHTPFQLARHAFIRDALCNWQPEKVSHEQADFDHADDRMTTDAVTSQNSWSIASDTMEDFVRTEL